MADKSMNLHPDLEIVRHGWCTKQGGSHKSWKRRYGCIVGSIFYYFKSEEDFQIFVDPWKAGASGANAQKKRQEVIQSEFDFTGGTLDTDPTGSRKMGVKTTEPLLNIYTQTRVFRIFFESDTLIWVAAFRGVLLAQEDRYSIAPDYKIVRDIVAEGDLQMSSMTKAGVFQKCSAILTFHNLLVFKSPGENIPILAVPLPGVKFNQTPSDFFLESGGVSHHFKGLQQQQQAEGTRKFVEGIAKILKLMQSSEIMLTPRSTASMGGGESSTSLSQPTSDESPQVVETAAASTLPPVSESSSEQPTLEEEHKTPQGSPRFNALLEATVTDQPPTTDSNLTDSPTTPDPSTPDCQSPLSPLQNTDLENDPIPAPPPPPPTQDSTPETPTLQLSELSLDQKPTTNQNQEISALISPSTPKLTDSPLSAASVSAPASPKTPTIPTRALPGSFLGSQRRNGSVFIAPSPGSGVIGSEASLRRLTSSYVEPLEESAEYKKVMEYQAILSQGASFTKHGRMGNPHRKHVWIDFKNYKICWSAAEGDKEFSSMNIPVSKIVKGCQTDTFSKWKDKDKKEDFCFSLVSGERTLDLQTDSEEEREKWVEMLWRVGAAGRSKGFC